ncbi:MAG: bifunctional metallophosphatase/5'-nucleotidase [Chloroflexota bacterium]
MARRATAIKQEREKASAERGGAPANVLLLDAGNTLFGQPLADKTRGRVVVEAMNKLGYDAMALGDHDLNRGVSVVEERAKDAKFPFLSANAVTAEGQRPVGKPYTVVTVDGRRIAIIGLSELMTAFPGGQQSELVKQDYLTAARDTIEEARKETTAVIVLSNLGQAQERELANKVPGIAVIVGGGSGPRLPQPEIVGDSGTVIVRTVGNGEELGICKLTLDKDGRAKNVEAKLVTLHQDVFTEDGEMRKLLDSFQSQ